MSKPVILVVDDDGPILVLMRSLLREFGFEPLVASSGQQALDALRTTRPQLVLLDRNMPGMGGDDVLRAMRANGDGSKDVPVLMLTGEPMTQDELQAIGANGAIQKPFDLSALLAQIRSWVSA